MFNKLIALIMLLAFVVSCAPTRPPREPRVAVVLGAGAARGFAHVGVLKVLEAQKVPIGMIVGTSAGSFVGGLYASGICAYDLQRLALGMQRTDIAEVSIFSSGGIVKGERIEEYFNKAVKNAPIEQFRIQFAAVATDIQTGEEHVFTSGNAGAAVRASCSIPGIYSPARIGDRLYVDGGVVSPVAVDAARSLGADIVIAVDISSDRDTAKPEGMVDTILQSISIMYSRLAAKQLIRADVVIRPNVGRISSSDFTRRNDAILEGEKAATDALPLIANAISAYKAHAR